MCPSHPTRVQAGLGSFGKTSQGADTIAASTVRPWDHNPRKTWDAPSQRSRRAALSRGSGEQGPGTTRQSSAPADPLRYATNYSTRINDFAAKGEMT